MVHRSKQGRLRRTRAALAIGAVITSTVLAGCGAGGSDNSDTDDGGTDDGGSISIAILEPDFIVPGRFIGGYGNTVIKAIFSPLVSISADGETTMVAAESVETPDNKVWTIKIKPWKFQNGEPITAQNYVDTINAAAYGPNAWGQNSRVSRVEGYDTLNPASGEPSRKTLSGVKVIDDLTFEVTLTQPDSQFLYNLADEAAPFMPLPKEAFDDIKAFDEAPIGNGPYKVVDSWKHNREIKLERWDGYEGPDVSVDDIDFKIYTADDAAFADFQGGNVDVSLMPTSKLPELATTYKDDKFISPATGSTWLTVPEWDDRFSPEHCEAISLAIDRQGIADKIFYNTVVPATGLIQPAAIGGSTDACGDRCDYDPEKAKEMFDAAGGFSDPIKIYNAGGPDEMVQALANNLRQNLGMNVTIENIEFSTLLDLTAKHDTGGFHIGGWGNTIPSPGDMLNNSFGFTSAGPNWFGASPYRSAEFESQLSDAAAASSVEESLRYFHEAEETLLAPDAFYAIPLYWSSEVRVLSPRVENFEFDTNASINYFTLKVS